MSEEQKQEDKDYIMHDMEKVFDTIDKAKEIVFSANIKSKLAKLKRISGYDTYKRLSLRQRDDSDLLVISSDFYNIVDIISHIE